MHTSFAVPAILACVCAHAQEVDIVLARDGDKPLSSNELVVLSKPNEENVAALVKSGYIRVQIDGNTLLLVDPLAPPLKHFHIQRMLLESFGGLGKAVRFGDLSPEAQAAVSQVFHIAKRDGVIHPDMLFGIQADAEYRFKVGDKPSLPYSIRLNQNPDQRHLEFHRSLEAHPYIADKPTEMPKVLPPPPRYSSEIVFSRSLEGRANNVVLYKRCTDEVAKLAEAERVKRDASFAKARKQLEDANPGVDLPDGSVSKSDIQPGVAAQLENQFADAFGVYGYASRDDALTAWRSATLTETGISFMLIFADGPQSPGYENFSQIQFGRTRR